MKGLLLQVYRSPGVATAGGLSDSLTVVGVKRVGEPIKPLGPESWAFEVTPEAPAVILFESDNPRNPPRLVPLEYLDPESGDYKIPEGQIGPTGSGSYAGCVNPENGMIDSRWSRLGQEVGFPMGMWLVPVFDRVESVESFKERKAAHVKEVAASKESEREFQKWAKRSE